MRHTTRRRKHSAPGAGQPGLWDTAAPPAPAVQPLPPTAVQAARAWYRAHTAPPPGPGSPAARAEGNLAAIRALRAAQTGRRQPTNRELAELARFTGWGAIPEIFETRPGRRPAWAEKAYTELSGLVNSDEILAAVRNTLNAHFTDPDIAAALWEAAIRGGFTGGQVLEPGCGTGIFISQAPPAAQITGVELDLITAQIATALHPAATIYCESFAETRLPAGSVDLVIGNVPFGDFPMGGRDPVTPWAGKYSIHNHCLVKALHLLRPGGLLIALTSRYTADAVTADKARREMASLADLIGAVRLPANSHQAAAGTKVVMDVLMLRRRAPGDPDRGLPWAEAAHVKVDGCEVALNQVFRRGGGGQVLGKLAVTSTGHGPDLTVTPGKGDLPKLIARALGQAADEARAAGIGWAPAGDVVPIGQRADTALPEGHIIPGLGGTFTIVDDGQLAPFGVPAAHVTELKDLCALRDTIRGLLAAEAATSEDTPQIAELRTELNRRYDAAYRRHGPLGRFTWRRTGRYSGNCEACHLPFKAKRRDLLEGEQLQARCPDCGQPATLEEGHGQVRPRAHLLFANDPAYPVVLALEMFDPESQTAAKAPVFAGRVIGPRLFSSHADNPQDAITICMDQHGQVRLDVIAGLLSCSSEDDARDQLGDLVYEVPPDPDGERDTVLGEVAADLAGMTGMDVKPGHVGAAKVRPDTGTPGTLVPAAQYLSGLTRRKLQLARAAVTGEPRFEVNVAALERVIPREQGPGEIKPKLGAAWIPASDVQAFFRELLDDEYLEVDHPAGSPVWAVHSSKGRTVLAVSTWGTGRRPAYDLAESLLTQARIEVHDTFKENGHERTVLNLDETVAAQDKANEITARFAEWIWEDPARTARLVARYNDMFNGITLRSYDGVKLTLPGLTRVGADGQPFTPHAHQHAAIARGVAEPAVLLAHSVGAGKTFEMVATIMELRRLGLIRKACVVVPNHMLAQFSSEWLQFYPQAKVLLAATDDLAADRRRRFTARVATGDWDAVVMTQSTFVRVPMDRDVEAGYREAEIGKVADWIEESEKSGGGLSVKRLEATKARLEAKLDALLDGPKDEGALIFEHLGFDYITVDEAHGYKNLFTVSAIPDAAINPGSQRASDLNMKLCWLRGQHPGGRVVTFATATPVANSITEAHVMTRYLRPDLLQICDVFEFDVWAATFGEIVTEIELAPEGGTSFRPKSRFARFVNVPELLRMFHVFADVKLPDDLKLPVPLLARRPSDGERTAEVSGTDPTPELEAYVKELGERAKKVRDKDPYVFDDVDEHGAHRYVTDNMLLICTHGRLAATDLRLVGQAQTKPGKITTAAVNMARIYREHPGKLQLAFCDLGTPRAGWNAYDDLAARLVGYEDGEQVNAIEQMLTGAELAAAGIPRDRIRYMHDAKTTRAKAQLFAACRAGHVSVLVGSTEKMGVGVNVQARAIALHHIDAPWRPADIEQREGRILRQGNPHEEVQIFRYVTLRSFDAYMWQTLSRKAHFIGQFMRGRLDVREIEDIGSTALSFNEIKAIATDNMLLIDQARAKGDRERLERGARAHIRNQEQLAWTVKSHEMDVAAARDTIEDLQLALTRRTGTTGDAFAMVVDGEQFEKRGDAGAAVVAFIKQQASELLDAMARRRSKAATWDDIPTGWLGGHKLLTSVEGYINMSGRVSGATIRFRFADVPGTDMLACYLADLKDTDKINTVAVCQRLEHRLAGIEASIADAEQKISRYEQEIEHARQNLGVPFPHAADLEAARALCEQIEGELAEFARKNQQADAAAGAASEPAAVVAA